MIILANFVLNVKNMVKMVKEMSTEDPEEYLVI